MESFVTGGTGFLGSTLVRRLVAEGDDVTVLARTPEKAETVLGDLDVGVVVGDMTDVEGFAEELAGIDRVYHTAAYFREYYGAGEHWRSLRAVNVEGTRDLLAAADHAGVEGVINTSTSGVVGRNPDRSAGDETTPPAPIAWENAYFRSKLLADTLVEGYLAASDLRVVTVLPGMMFGPGDYAPTPGGRLVLETLRGDLPMTFDGGIEVVDVRDVAAGMVRAAERGETGEHYLLSNQYVSLPELTRRVSALAGREPPRVVPYPVVYAAAMAAERWAEVTGGETLLTRAGIRTLRARLAVDSGRARRELGFECRPLAETLSDTAEWFVDRGEAPGVRVSTGAPIQLRP